MITIGVILFMQQQKAQGKGAGKRGGSASSGSSGVLGGEEGIGEEWWKWITGIMLLFGYTFSDAFTSTWQGQLYEK